MNKQALYLNCDMGEGLENEAEIMPFVQAANIACGGHAGDAKTMENVMRLAKAQQVDIGIHPAYPDRKNFGRLTMPFDESLFTAAWSLQFSNFSIISKNLEVEVKHIKPHGALYHDLSMDSDLTALFLEVCLHFFPKAKMFGSPDSQFFQLAAARGFEVIREGFADRGYLADGKLAPRAHAQGLIHEAADMSQQILDLWDEGKVKTIEGEKIDHVVDTICIHGDHPNSVENLQWFWKNNGRHNLNS